MLKNKKWCKWILGLVIFVCFVQFVRMLKVPRIRENVKSSALIVENAEVTPVDFWIRGREKIHVGSHAEVVIPWLAWLSKGTYYRLTGHIKYDGHKARIKFKEDTKPVLMFKSGDDYYLMVQDYFRTERNYIYRREPKQWRFSEISFAQLSAELMRIEFQDWELGRLYKISCVRSVLKEKGVEQAVSKLHEYVKANPRTFYGEHWKPPKKKKGYRRKVSPADTDALLNMSQDLMQSLEDHTVERTVYWTVLVTMLKASRPNDFEDEIRFICGGLHVLDPERAKQVVGDILLKVRKENIPKDNRLSTLEQIFDMWQHGRTTW